LYKIKQKQGNDKILKKDENLNINKKEYVYCQKRGKGEIIERYAKNGKTYIQVKFKYETTKFIEDGVYESGSLTKVN
jgi:hypothetical protein